MRQVGVLAAATRPWDEIPGVALFGVIVGVIIIGWAIRHFLRK